MLLTSTVEETIREVIDAVMNARIYAERFKEECNMKVSIEVIAFDLAIVQDAKGTTVELAEPEDLQSGGAAANRVQFNVKVEMQGFGSRG